MLGTVNIGCRTSLHGYAGLRYLDLEDKHNRAFTLNFNGVNTPDNGTIVGNAKSDFSGVGPLLGFDAQYYLGYGFGLVGHFDGSLVVGRINADNNTTFQAPADAFGNPAFINTDTFNQANTRRLVPNTDG